jgi:hypothetical protein
MAYLQTLRMVHELWLLWVWEFAVVSVRET